MTAPVTPGSPPASAATSGTVRHWHVTESAAGCLPEAEPYTSDDGGMALDALAHLLADHAQTFPDPEDSGAVYAGAVAELYCTCRQGVRSAEHHDAMTAVHDGRGICEQIGDRVFGLTCCTETDCLKYCPDPDCGTTTSVCDADTRCWCCGATYVDRQACSWLA